MSGRWEAALLSLRRLKNPPLASLSELRFRAMAKADLNEVYAIESAAYSFPWSKGIFSDCLRMGYYCRVLLGGRRIVSYGVMSVAVDEAHILNLCVEPALGGRGLARKMLAHLLKLAKAKGGKTVFLEVRPSNEAALHIYRTSGFCEVGIRSGYYPGVDRREDGLIMAKTL